MAIDMSQFQEIFIEESFESLATMESGLLMLDLDEPNQEVINDIFRAAHSIKGGAGTFNYPEISEFTHVQESLLEMVRSNERSLNKEMVDVFLDCVDCVRNMLEASRTDDGSYDQARIDSLTSRLEEFQSGAATATSNGIATTSESTNEDVEVGEEDKADAADAEIAEVDGTEADSIAVESAAATSVQTQDWTVVFKPHEDMLVSGNDPFRLIRELCALGSAEVNCHHERLPDFDSLDPERIYLDWTINLTSSCSETEIRDIFDWVEGDCDLTITGSVADATAVVGDVLPATESTPQPDASFNDLPSVTPPESSAILETTNPATSKTNHRNIEDINMISTESSSIRVDIDKIEQLINLVGELVITQSTLNQYSNEIVEHEHILTGLQQLSSNIQELQEQTMRIRMLPIDFVFQRIPRLIRDLSTALDKQVAYEIVGKNTEVDKTVLEKISDPLVHLIRNAIDHGIEDAADRRESGKPAEALIQISAEHQSGNIVITLKDDGRGLDFDRIKNKAIEKGLINETDVLTHIQIQNLIFAPGFSTAKSVSDVSGRGVGLDVVRQNIKSLGGDVTVSSTPGFGCEFRITLPLTMAILEGQLVRLGKDVFVIPMVNIEKSVHFNKEHHNAMPGGGELYRFEDEYVPVLRLSELYGKTHSAEKSDDGILVVINTDQTAAILVDEVIGQQQVVIRSLETNFHRVDTIAGATILGDGTVALILDANEVVQRAHVKGSVALAS